MLTFSDVTFEGPGINFAESDISDLLIRRPIITTLYTANATFVVPDLCESISIAAVGGGGGGSVGVSPYGGGGGGGGGLGYRNDVDVIPGETLNIVVGQGGAPGVGNGTVVSAANLGGQGGATYIQRANGQILLLVTGGTAGFRSTSNGLGGGGGGDVVRTLASNYTGALGGRGGYGGGISQSGSYFLSGGGGGAGGWANSAIYNTGTGQYNSPGGDGGAVYNPTTLAVSATAKAGTQGGGGGGGIGYQTVGTYAGNGGGVALAANIFVASLASGALGAQGTSGAQGSDPNGSTTSITTTHGGGGAGVMGGTGFTGSARSGGNGALLMLAPGNYRSFPKPTASQIPNYDIISAPVINVNYSADFRSMTKSMYLNDSEATNLTNTCTIEFWMYMAATRPNINVCLLSPGSASANGLFVAVGGASGNQLRIGPYYQITGLSGLRGAFLSTGGSIPTGVWTHIVIQYTAGKLTVYKNGYMMGMLSYTGFAIDSQWNTTSVATSLTVGNYAGGGNFNFNGLISNLRLTKGKALYPSVYPNITYAVQMFTPPTAPYNLTTNGSTGLGWGNLTDPLETDVRSLAFSTSNISEDKSIFTGGIGTWVSNGQVPVSTLSPF